MTIFEIEGWVIIEYQSLLLFICVPSQKSGSFHFFAAFSYVVFMSRWTAHIVAHFSVEFELRMISHQQDELCTNFYGFLQDLMNSRCITKANTNGIMKAKCQLLRMYNGCSCIKKRNTKLFFLIDRVLDTLCIWYQTIFESLINITNNGRRPAFVIG